MSVGGENFEKHPIPGPSPELALYLETHQDVDPRTVLLLDHVPPLIGGLKSNKFIIQVQAASPDAPPDPDARIDLGEFAVPGRGLSAFADFFKASEAQADAQYETALFEAQQVLADASERDVHIETLFIPDTVNSTASEYFRRLTRLAQDTGISVVTRVVDYEDDAYQSFRRFEPVRARSVADYWEMRASESRVLVDPLIRLGRYSAYTMEGTHTTDVLQVADALGGVVLPIIRPPLIFTSFEQLQRDYPGSAISDPDMWEVHKKDLTLVGSEAEYCKVRQEREIEQDNLRRNMRRVAAANTEDLRRLLSEGDAPHSDKLSIIRKMTVDSDANGTEARMILAKLGDKESAQSILREIQDKTGGWGDESLTIAPLGVHLRHDARLFSSVVEEVKNTIADNPGSSHRLLSLLGALYHSHDPQVAELLASHLTVPERNVEAYASTVLHAAARWMPEYAMALAYRPQSEQCDKALSAIEVQTAAFIDAHNRGELEGVHQHMVFSPDDLLPLLFWFSNPAHRAVLAESVTRLFKEGGSILVGRKFEDTYLLYRAQYGDLPELSQYIRTTS